MKKRLFAFLIMMAMLLSAVNLTAFATEEIPDVVAPGMDGGDVPASQEDIDKLLKEEKTKEPKETEATEADSAEEGEDAADEAEEPEETESTRPYRAEDQCGEKLLWNLDGGKLTITGSGAMDDYTDDNPPWFSKRTKITEIVLTGGVTTIGANAFTNCDGIKEVDLGDSLTELGSKCFSFCDGLTELTLPSTFKNFAEECLSHCSNLKTINCEGSMPHFRLNCVWDTYATIVYPEGNPWPVQYIEELEDAFHGRIEFLSSDGTDPYIRAEEQEVTFPTSAETEAAETEPEETEVETTAAPETTEQTEYVPETMETSAETEAVMATVEETMLMGNQTEPTQEQEAQPKRSGGMLGLMMVIFVLSGLCIGALVFRMAESRRNRYDD